MVKAWHMNVPVRNGEMLPPSWRGCTMETNDSVVPAVLIRAADHDALAQALADAKATWRCFHCGFETQDNVAAEIHFGDGEGAEAICLVWSKMTEDEKLNAWVGGEEQLLQARREAADAKADVKNPASLRLLVSELESRCRKADEAIQQCRTYLRGCMNHAFDETPIVEVAKDVSEEFHRNRYQIQCIAKERDTIAKERDVANLLLKRLMCVVVPDKVVPNDMKEFVRDSAATVLKDLYEYLKTDVDLRKAEHDAK